MRVWFLITTAYDVITRSLGNPRGRYDATEQQFHLIYKTKVVMSSRTWRRLSNVSTASFTIIDVDLHTITNKQIGRAHV